MENKGDLYLQILHEMQRRNAIWNRIINEIKHMPIDWDMEQIDMNSKPCDNAELMPIPLAIDKIVTETWEEDLKTIDKQLYKHSPIENKMEKN